MPILLLLSFMVWSTNAFSETWRLLDDSDHGCLQGWKERKFTKHSTVYTTLKKERHCVLFASSKKSASGLWRLLTIKPLQSATISWQWLVDHSLTAKQSERNKKGDDYAARVFVVFEPHFFNWKTRSICYVWASQQPAGSIYRSPYAANVGTFVLESGSQRAGKWVLEERDVVADYKRFFGESPKEISAVAVMVDTDNTGGVATASFSDIVLTAP